MPGKPNLGRKLLVASVGIATVTYMVACGSSATSGNLLPPPGDGGGDSQDTAVPPDVTSGNLLPPQDTGTVDTGKVDTGADASDSKDGD